MKGGEEVNAVGLRAAGMTPRKIMAHSCQLGFHEESSALWLPGQLISPLLESLYSPMEMDYANED